MLSLVQNHVPRRKDDVAQSIQKDPKASHFMYGKLKLLATTSLNMNTEEEVLLQAGLLRNST